VSCCSSLDGEASSQTRDVGEKKGQEKPLEIWLMMVFKVVHGANGYKMKGRKECHKKLVMNESNEMTIHRNHYDHIASSFSPSTFSKSAPWAIRNK